MALYRRMTIPVIGLPGFGSWQKSIASSQKSLERLSRFSRTAAYILRGTELHRKYRRSTMIEVRPFVENCVIAQAHCNLPSLKHGAVVECGTWRGGMSAALMEIGGSARQYLFFDSFEGLPPAKDIDGPRAREWQSNKDEDGYYDNCSASLDEFRETIARVQVPDDNISIHKGFFEDTLPGASCPPIAVLRLDADWYTSTMECLQKFWPTLLPGGVLLIDDYGVWDGCTKAVHDFFSTMKTASAIQRGRIASVAYVIKA